MQAFFSMLFSGHETLKLHGLTSVESREGEWTPWNASLGWGKHLHMPFQWQMPKILIHFSPELM